MFWRKVVGKIKKNNSVLYIFFEMHAVYEIIKILQKGTGHR